VAKTFDDIFALDQEYIKAGAKVDYGDAGYFVLLPMGPENKQLQKITNKIQAPYRRQIDTDTLPEETNRKLSLQIFAQGIIAEMCFKQADGSTLEDTIDNRISVLERLPGLFLELLTAAQKRSNFQRVEDEADAKN
jgi:hypothetical protein